MYFILAIGFGDSGYIGLEENGESNQRNRGR